MAEIQPQTTTAPAQPDAPVVTSAPAADPMADAVAFLEGAAPPEEGAQASEDAPQDKQAEPAKPEAPPTNEEKPPEPEALSPQMQALARREKRIQDERAAVKAEREAFDKERSEWLTSRGAVEEYQRLAKQDLVALADKVQLSPEERMRMATDLWHSAQSEKDRPADYRAKTQTRSEIEEAKRIAEQARKEAEEARKMYEQERRQRETAQVRDNTLSTLEQAVTEMAEKLPYVSAFLKHDRAAAREELWSMAVQAYQDDPETELTAGELVGRYEAGLAQRYGWIAPRPAAATPKSQVKPEAERKPPTSLSASRTAAPTQGRTEPASEEDLIADAAAYLESLKHA